MKTHGVGSPCLGQEYEVVESPDLQRHPPNERHEATRRFSGSHVLLGKGTRPLAQGTAEQGKVREGCARGGRPPTDRLFWAFRRPRDLGLCLSWRPGLATSLRPSRVASCQALRLLARQKRRGICRVLATQTSQLSLPEPPPSVSTFEASSCEGQTRRGVLVSPCQRGQANRAQGAHRHPRHPLYLLLCLSSIFLHERLPPAKSSRSCGLTHCWQYRQRLPLTMTIGPLRWASHTPTRMLRGCSERRSALQPSMIQACPPSSEAMLIEVKYTPECRFNRTN